jgi:hypothetical protein
VDDPQVMVIGDRDSLPKVGREVAKRPSVVAIAREYEMAVMITDGGQMPVYLAPRVVRVRRFGWVDGLAREVLPEPPEPQRRVTVIRAQPRRRPRSKR